MHLDDSILQSKTVTTLIEVLKEARTITKEHTNACRNINEKIEHCVQRHDKAISMPKIMSEKEKHINRKNTFLKTYRVNI